MVSGVQSTANLNPNTWTVISNGPSSPLFTQLVTVSIANRNASQIGFQLAVNNTGTASPATSDYIEYNTPINSNNIFERRGIALYYGQQIMVYTISSGVSAVAYAMEGSSTALSGIMSRNDLSAATWTQAVSTPTAGRIKVCTISLVNRAASSTTINIAVTQTPLSPALAEYIEYTVTLSPYTVLERTGIIISNGYYLAAYAANTGVSCVAYGIDDSA